MDTRHKASCGKHYRNRDREIREHVVTLVKYLDHVIHDIKYVVGDLEVLLQQIDLVTRQLNEQSVPKSGVGEENARSSTSNLIMAREPSGLEYHPITIARTEGLNAKLRHTSPSKKSRKQSPVHRAAASSNASSCDDSVQVHDDDGFDYDRSSLEFNAMWDTEYDKELISAQWQDELDDALTEFGGNIGQHLSLVELERSSTSWIGDSLEQSLTSGIDMLTFTDESDDEALVFGQQRENRCNISRDYLAIDPNHVCCKDVIPLGSGSTYCGVYEAVLDACLESCVDITRSESFTSPAYISEDEELESVHSGCMFEARYNTGINPWTAFTMVPLGSVHSSEEEISETSSDILNDNILPTLVLDNMNSNSNGNIESTDVTKKSGSANTRHVSLLVC